MIGRVLNAYKTSFSGLSREIWLLSLVMLVNRAGTMAVPFMSLYVTVALGRSLADAGLIITLFGVGSVMGALLGGFLTDRIGFRWVQITAAMVSGLLFWLFGSLSEFGWLCLLTLLLSMVADALRPANHAAIAAFSNRENLTRSYTLNRLAINLGWAVGGALGGILAAINYHLLFWVEGGTLLLAGILIWGLLPANIGVSKKFSLVGKKPAGVRMPWHDKNFILFMLLATGFTTAFFLVFRLVPVFWKAQWQLSERVIGMLLGLNGIMIAFMEMVLVRRWEAKGNTMRYIVAGCIACAVGYSLLLLPVPWYLALATVFMVAVTLGEMLAFPFITSHIMLQSNEHNRGAYATAITLSWSFAQIAGPSGGGFIAEKFGFGWLWAALCGLCLLMAFLFFRFTRFEQGQKKALLPKEEAL
ncbi:MAG: MFS transporter [Chitinophagaceae bacterium]|jgi:MFS family permease|nr:MFS transporter [Chitinophagaceae bacterium]